MPMGEVTSAGEAFIAGLIAQNIQNFKIRLYNGQTFVKTLPINVQQSGTNVLIHAEDDSSDEYTFDRFYIEDANGVQYWYYFAGSTDKHKADRVVIDWTIPVTNPPLQNTV